MIVPYCREETTLAQLLALASNYDHVTTHVVFLHGLDGDKEKTWLSTGAKPELWPAWLTADFAYVGAWSVGYDASATKWRGSSMPLPDRAENILARLMAEPRLSKGYIVFIGHSLGGLVIKQLLRSADREASRNPTAKAFLRRTRRVAFLGTPHLGAGLAGLARMLGSVARRSSSTAALERNDPNLRDLNFWYRQYSADNGIENLVLTESRAIKILGLQLPDWLGFVVLPDSSDPGVGVVPIPIDADHINIVKPESRESDVYVHVSSFVSRPFTAARDFVIAECLTKQASDLRALENAAERQAQSLVEMERLIKTRSFAPRHGEAGASIIDSEAQRRLRTVSKCRFFAGYDLINHVRRLAESVENGELSGASNSVKAEVLAWSARFLSATDKEMAQKLVDQAVKLGDGDVIEIARAFVAASHGNSALALGLLAPINTSLAKSAAFIIVKNQEGSKAAFAWLERTGVTPSDLDPDGKLFALQSCLQDEDWGRSLELTESLTEADFDYAPALAHLAAEAHLVQTVPAELRTVVFQQALLNAADFPLASDSNSIHHRRTAQELFEKAARNALLFDLTKQASIASDIALWLALRDIQSFESARGDLEKSMRDPATALRRLPLALQFGLRVDLAAVEAEIERQTALSGGTSADAAIARFALAFVQDEPGQVAAYIDRHRSQLNHHLDPRGVAFVEIEMLARSGQTQQAESRLSELLRLGLSGLEECRLRRLIKEASGTDSVDQRLALYEGSRSITDLRNLVVALEDRKDWGRLAGFGRSLFDLTHDLLDATRYAIALYETGQLDDLLALLQEFPSLLEQSEQLQGLRCWALFQQGAFVEAHSSLLQLRTKRDSANYRSLVVNIAIASGDWESLQVFIEEEWTARESRSPNDLIRVAKLAQMVGTPRTKDLVLESARRGAQDPKILIGCYMIASESGWEDNQEVSKWMQEAAALSDENGPIQKVSLKELVDRQPGWEEHETQTWSMLAQGKAPMFSVARLVHRSLLSLFLVPALANLSEADVRKRAIIHAFSGARGDNDAAPNTLAMDATALLTAEMLGVTQSIIDHFSEIAIPHSTLGWLFEEKRRILFHQPSRVSDAQELRQLIAEGSLKAFERTTLAAPELASEVGPGLAAMLADVVSNCPENDRQRLVVHAYPVYRVGSLMEEEADLTGYEGHLCSCVAVVEKLVERGELTSSEAQDCKSFLAAHERPWPNGPRIDDSAVLYLNDAAVSHLQHLELLPRLRRAGLTAFVSAHELTECDALLRYDTQTARAVALVEGLRLRLRKGIAAGKVRVGRQHRLEKDDEEFSICSHPTVAILDLSVTTDATVVDDRFINQHRTITSGDNQRPLLTSLDVLNILKGRNVLTADQAMELRTVLRRAGMSLVPLERDELNSFLAGAKIVDGKILETAELKALRESVLQLRMSDVLQLPMETVWLDRLFEACFRSLQYQWCQGSDPDAAAAISDWLYDLMDVRQWSHRFAGLTPDASDRYRGQITALMMLPATQPAKVRNAYWRWFEDRVLLQIKEENGPLFSQLLTQVRELISFGLKNAPRLGN